MRGLNLRLYVPPEEHELLSSKRKFSKGKTMNSIVMLRNLSGHNMYHTEYLSHTLTPKNFSNAIINCFPFVGNDGYRHATNLVRNCGLNLSPVIYSDNTGVDLYYIFDCVNKQIEVRKNTLIVFKGELSQFHDWAKNYENKFSQYKGKVVQFTYNGGTHPGAQRTVRVEEVEYDQLGGLDLSEPDLKQAYRNYKFEKISNIRQLN